MVGSAASDVAALLRTERVVALTGAGISTESGIPDYRGPSSRDRVRKPVQHRDFVRDPRVRARYWARAVVGWERFSAARPNDGHGALARLEARGRVAAVITQNVDRLHQAAGSREVVELHGALHEVRCLGCGTLEDRAALQARLLDANPGFDSTGSAAPDGDADLDPEALAGFCVVGCAACGGVLKPNVVFFGDNVPRPVVDRALSLVEAAGALLVAGTSLAVYSGLRFVRRARERGIPIVIVNLGETRGDDLATAKLDAPLGEALPLLERAL